MATAPKPTSNTEYWSLLEVTDPRYTKGFKRAGGFSGTDINPTWRIKRMTETFGPMGDRWGYILDRAWIEQIEMRTKEGTKPTQVAFAQVRVWWLPANEPREAMITSFVDLFGIPAQARFTGPQIGGTELSYGPDEAYKMAITDALGKCLVMLGLAADIYLGLFDDSKYQRQAQARFEKAETQPVTPEQTAQAEADAKALVDEASQMTDLETMTAWFAKEATPRLKAIRAVRESLYNAALADLRKIKLNLETGSGDMSEVDPLNQGQ